MGPFYSHLSRDAVPEKLLLATAFRVCCWIERMNLTPRVTGTLQARCRDTTISCMCRPYTPRMVQRALDAYAALSDAERAAGRRRARWHRLARIARLQVAAPHREARQRARAAVMGRGNAKRALLERI